MATFYEWMTNCFLQWGPHQASSVPLSSHWFYVCTKPPYSSLLYFWEQRLQFYGRLLTILLTTFFKMANFYDWMAKYFHQWRPLQASSALSSSHWFYVYTKPPYSDLLYFWKQRLQFYGPLLTTLLTTLAGMASFSNKRSSTSCIHTLIKLHVLHYVCWGSLNP